MNLLTREEFNERVFQRDDYKCVVCGKEAVDAHHLIERKLFDDGGYYVDNGVSLCSDCHWDAEFTNINPFELRILAGINNKILPEGFDENKKYDKWANVINEDGSRTPGPMFEEDQVQKVLNRSGLIYLFYVK